MQRRRHFSLSTFCLTFFNTEGEKKNCFPLDKVKNHVRFYFPSVPICERFRLLVLKTQQDMSEKLSKVR